MSLGLFYINIIPYKNRFSSESNKKYPQDSIFFVKEGMNYYSLVIFNKKIIIHRNRNYDVIMIIEKLLKLIIEILILLSASVDRERR